MAEKNKIFTDFQAVSKQAFQKKIEKELQGKDYKKTLVKPNFENLEIEPIYWQKDLEKINHKDSLAGKFPFVRGNKAQANHWEIREDILVNDIKGANKKALNALMNGADSLAFDISNLETNKELLTELLNEILPQHISLNFIPCNKALKTLEYLIDELKRRNIDFKQIKGSLNFDPFKTLLLSGNWPQSEHLANEQCVEIVKLLNQHLPFYRGINIDASLYHNAGASIIQELAFSLAQGNYYLALMSEKGLSIDQISSKIQFTVAVGSNYLMEIAKIRAWRMLWARIVEQYQPQYPCSMVTFIHAVTSKFNQTAFDAHNNMLRSTAQAMAAAIGGADSLSVMAFDAAFGKTDDFSERMARNTQQILAEEAHLNKVADPAGGSYYIENLTDSIAQHAWSLFQEVEKQGGFIKALEKTYIQNEIEQVAAQKKEALANKELVLVGCNKYRNNNEKLSELPKNDFYMSARGDQYIKPIGNFRLAAAFEQAIMEENSAKI